MADVIFDAEALTNCPSIADNIPIAVERAYRAKSAWFIEVLGKELKLCRLVVSTAQVLCHRFYMCQSFKTHDRYLISAACLFLSTKVEESTLKSKNLQAIVTTYVALRNKLECSDEKDVIINKNYKETELKILLSERIILHTLDFNIHVSHPYHDALKKIKTLKAYIPEDSRKEFHQVVINLINDSYRTAVCLQHTTEDIAISCIFLTTLILSITPITVRNRECTWYELLQTDILDHILQDICEQLIRGYTDASCTFSYSPSCINIQKLIQVRSHSTSQDPHITNSVDNSILENTDISNGYSTLSLTHPDVTVSTISVVSTPVIVTNNTIINHDIQTNTTTIISHIDSSNFTEQYDHNNDDVTTVCNTIPLTTTSTTTITDASFSQATTNTTRSTRKRPSNSQDGLQDIFPIQPSKFNLRR